MQQVCHGDSLASAVGSRNMRCQRQDRILPHGRRVMERFRTCPDPGERSMAHPSTASRRPCLLDQPELRCADRGDDALTAETKSLAYGYIRVTAGESDAVIRRTEHEVRSFAEAEGYCLVTIIYEDDSGFRRAFTELTEELRRAGAHHVIVPSLAHLSDHPLLRESMLACLELHASAQVSAVRSSGRCHHDRQNAPGPDVDVPIRDGSPLSTDRPDR